MSPFCQCRFDQCSAERIRSANRDRAAGQRWSVVHLRPSGRASSIHGAKRRIKCDRLNRAIALFYVDAARTRLASFDAGIDDNGWSDYDCNSANKHWSPESRFGPRHRIGPLQSSQQFGHPTEKRSKSLPSQFGQKYDHNSARNTRQRA
jgi:hypothetical protein